MSRIVLAALLAGLVLAAPAHAHAYDLTGAVWPTRTIAYNASSVPAYRSAVELAAREWNDAGVGVRFVQVPADDAAVRVRYGGRTCDGVASVGIGRRYARADVRLGRGCSARLIRLTAIHELGHVLGLDHENERCARMNPWFDQTGTPNRCGRRALGTWLERPLLNDDLRGARALFGPLT